MDEIFIPGRDAVEVGDDEEDDVEDRSTWIAENEDNLNAHADLVAEEEVGTGISVRVTEEEDRELMERLAREVGSPVLFKLASHGMTTTTLTCTCSVLLVNVFISTIGKVLAEENLTLI